MDEGFVREVEVTICTTWYYLEHCDGSKGWMIDSGYYNPSWYLGHYVIVFGPIEDPLGGGPCAYINVANLEVIVEPDPCRPNRVYLPLLVRDYG